MIWWYSYKKGIDIDVYIIGITGGTGAGKSTAIQALQEMGAFTLNCDVIYHQLLTTSIKMKTEIETYFKEVSTNGEIDRSKLAKIVLSDADSLKKLNQITHKFIKNEIEQRIDSFKKQGGKIVAIDAIALIESGQSEKCNIVVGVTASPEVRMSRIINRDSLTNDLAQLRINAQQPESYYIENCDYILENNYNTEAVFKEKCIEFFKKIIPDYKTGD
jgi:dephospho-CoA kinase